MIRHLIFRVPKRDHNFYNHPCVELKLQRLPDLEDQPRSPLLQTNRCEVSARTRDSGYL